MKHKYFKALRVNSDYSYAATLQKVKVQTYFVLIHRIVGTGDF